MLLKDMKPGQQIEFNNLGELEVFSKKNNRPDLSVCNIYPSETGTGFIVTKK